jgi:hypothetical protein
MHWLNESLMNAHSLASFIVFDRGHFEISMWVNFWICWTNVEKVGHFKQQYLLISWQKHSMQHFRACNKSWFDWCPIQNSRHFISESDIPTLITCGVCWLSALQPSSAAEGLMQPVLFALRTIPTSNPILWELTGMTWESSTIALKHIP